MRASAQPLAVIAALLLGALLLSPLSAHAATPGVNLAGVPGAVQLDQAAAGGAKDVRVFAQRDAFPARDADCLEALGKCSNGLRVHSKS